MSLKPEIIAEKLASLSAAVAVTAGVNISSQEGAFYAAHKLRALRTEMGAIIKALEVDVPQPSLPGVK